MAETVVTVYRLESDLDSLTAGLDQARAGFHETERASKGLDSAQKATNASTGALTGSLAKMAGGLAGAITAYGALVQRVTAARHRLVELHTTTGHSTEALSGMRLAARLAGRSLDEVVPKDFGTRMAEAASGSGRTAEAFEALGVEVDDGKGKLRDQNEVFAETIRKLQGVQEGSERSAVAKQLLKGQSDALMASLGDRSLEEWIAHADHLGQKVGPDAAAQIEAMNDAFSSLSLSIQLAGEAAVDSLGDKLIPVVNRASETIVALSTFTAEFVSRTVDSGAKLLVPFVGMREAVSNLSEAWDKAVDQTIAFEGATRAAAATTDDQRRATDDLSRTLVRQREGGQAAAAAMRELERAERDAAAAARELQTIEDRLLASIRRSRDDQLDAMGQVRAARAESLRALMREHSALLELERAGVDVSEQQAQIERARVEVVQRAEREIQAIRDASAQADAERLARADAAMHASMDRMIRDIARAEQQAERSFANLRDAQMQLAGAIAGSTEQMSGAILGFTEEGSAAYYALFAVQQAAAIAGVIVDTQRAIMASMTIPPPAGPILATAAGVAGAGALATIIGTTIQGAAGGGGGSRPSSGGGGSRGGAGASTSTGAQIAPLGADDMVGPDMPQAPQGQPGVVQQAFQIQIQFEHDMYEATVPDAADTPGSVMYDLMRNRQRSGHAKRIARRKNLVA